MPPIHYERSSYYYSSQRGCGCLVPILYIVVWLCLPEAVLAHSYPTDYNNFFWGFVQGLWLPFIGILGLFNDELALYQEGAGTMYGFGYVVGIALFVWYILIRDL